MLLFRRKTGDTHIPTAEIAAEQYQILHIDNAVLVQIEELRTKVEEKTGG